MGATHLSGPLYVGGVQVPTDPVAGRIFWADSANVLPNDVENKYSTIAGALAYARASKGDIIYVAPGHAEAISAAGSIELSKAGVSVIGLGQGSLKPTLTWGTATTATLLVSADNCLLRNFRFVGNIDSLVKFLDVNADYFTIEDCDFVTSSTKEALSFVNIRTTKDHLTIRRCKAFQPTDPAGSDGGADTGFLYCVDTEHILVEDCQFIGNFETAIIHNRTTACKYLWVKNCHGMQQLSGAEPFQLVAGASGAMLGGGFITTNEAAATIATLVGTIGDGFFILQPASFGNDGGGEQGGIVITAAS
jgi:hypothetical protein